MEWKKVQIIRSNRKSLGLEIRPDQQILVRAPYYLTDSEIRKFIEEKAGWIETHLQRIKLLQEERESIPREPGFTRREIEDLANQALKIIPERVRFYAPIVGVDYGKITIRNQRSRWGSCSGKGNLNFNCILMKTPPEVLDYVVVHELCHRLEMNHSKVFWAEVARVLPDYDKARAWLKEQGGAIIERMTGE